MKKMKAHKVEVIPTINKANQLQGFRVEYKGVNLKASEIHRSMSGNKLIAEISKNSSQTRLKEAPKNTYVFNRSVQLSTNLVNKITKDIVEGVLKIIRDTGIGI